MLTARLCCLLCTAALLATSGAFAQTSSPQVEEVPLVYPQTAKPKALYFSALAGLSTGAPYFGSDETDTGFFLSPSPRFLGLGGLRLGTPSFKDDPLARRDGVSVGGAFRFIRERDAEDYDELTGLDDIDPTLEVGVSLSYAVPNAELFADLRYGLGGSDGWVADLGANYVVRPTDRLALRAGPRLLYGSENYTNTYFGISPQESQRSGLPAFEADAGLVSTGVEVSATYRLGERWWLEGRARYERFQDDAADSPIVQQGSEQNTSVTIGVRRAFILEF